MLRRSLVLLLALTAAPGAARAAYPGGDGAILYRGTAGGASVLYLREGHQVTRLLEGVGDVRDATFSPHGRRLAMARVGTLRGIWVTNADGTDLRALTPPGVAAAQPSWSPDGAQVAFARRSGGRPRIQVVGADGTGLRGLVRSRRPQSDPAWSVTGQIAYVQRTAHGSAIFVVDAGGGRARRLTPVRGRAAAPDWSPDGRRLAYVAGDALVVMDAGGRHARRIARLRGLADPAWSPSGGRILLSAGPDGRRRIWSVRPDGGGRTAVSTTASDGSEPDWQPTGFDPVVMAAGDIACEPTSPNYNGGLGYPSECAQRRTSDLLARTDLDGVLVLGDAQYDTGALGDFRSVFDPTWGRLRALLHPVVGNHEESDPGPAGGYFDDFDGVGAQDGPAGPRGLGYYSFDIGTWHLVALNSNCGKLPGGCAAGSPEEQWLRADLAAHPAACTLAFWHAPRFGSAGSNTRVAPLFQALYDAGVDVLLTGHQHLYERLVPVDPTGAADNAQGVREFIVGTGGKSLVGTSARNPASAVLAADSFGVLQLTLGAGSYAWRFVGAGPGTFTDTGSAPCH